MHRKRIARGARWLDKEVPDWFERINISELENDSDTCVIAQVMKEDARDYWERRYFGWLVPQAIKDSRYDLLTFLFPNMAYGTIDVFAHGFIPIRETEEQWRDAWIAEIALRKVDAKADSDQPEYDYVPQEWEHERSRV